MAGLSTGAGAPVVKVYHEKSMILPDVSRVLACLYEKDVKFDTAKDSYKDILRLQVSRSVPVPFYDGPTFLQESRAICRYVAETYERRGYPFLLGKDVLERASIEQWLRHEEHAFDPPSRALFCHLAFPMHDDDSEDTDKEKRKLEEVLEVYEQRLGESEFLAGNKFTLADLVHLPNTHHIVTSEKFAYLYDSRKNVQRWWNTISARDSWQQVLRDIKNVEEQYHEEELDQQQQWQTEPLPTSGGRNIRIDNRKQTGTESRTVLVPPPSAGIVSTLISSVPQEEQPLASDTASQDKSSQRKENNFFTTTGKTQSPSKPRTSTTQKPPSSVQNTTSTFFTPTTPTITPQTPQKTDTDKATSEDASSLTKSSQRSPKEASDKHRHSAFFKASSHTDETATFTKPSPPENSKTSNKIPETHETNEAVAPHKSSPRPTKVPNQIDEPDFYKTETKPASVDPQVDKPIPYTKPTTNIHQTSYDKPYAQRAVATSPGTEADETSSDQRSVVQPPYARDQRVAAHLSEHVASKDSQGETVPGTQNRGIQDSTKEAREADQKIPEPPRGLPSSTWKSKAPPTLKVPGLSTMQGESKEGTHGITSEDERFSTKRLRKMFEESEAAAVKSQFTDFRTTKEETPSIYKKSSDVQDRSIMDDGKTGGSPSTGTRTPGIPTNAAERRVASPPKGGMARDDRDATKPQKSPSINDQEQVPEVPSQAPTARARNASESSNEASSDDGLAGLSTIDQWRNAYAPAPVKQVAPDAPRNDELAITMGIDKRTPSTPKKAPTDARNGAARGISDEQSDKSSTMDERAVKMTTGQGSPSDTHRSSASIQEAVTGERGTSDDMFGKTSGAAPKQTTAQVASPDDRTTKLVERKPASIPPKQEPVSSSQQTIGPVKGITPTLQGITGDESAKTAMVDERAIPHSPVQAPSSDGQSASTALQGAVPDARGKNVAVQPSVTGPRDMPTTPRRQEPTPDTQRRTTPDLTSAKAPPLPSFTGTRNEKTGIAEAGQTNKIAPGEQPVGGVPKNDGAPAAGPSLMKSQKNINEEAYNDGAPIQNLSSDRSRVQPAENKKKQGDDAALLTDISRAKEDLFANSNQNITGQVQATSTDDTQQVKSNRSNRKSDGSTKPTQIDGNEGNLPRSERPDSSSNP